MAFVSILGFIQWRYGKKSRETSTKLTRQNQFIESQQQEIMAQNEKLSRRNQELSDLNHEKDTLMSIVAHDLKSPLNRIKGIADVVEMELEIQGKLTPEQAHYIKMTKEATQAGLYLIKDLLDVHMLEENVEPHYSTFDLSAFLLDKIHAFQPAADAKRIHLHITEVQSEEVHLDKDYLGRIVDNLLSNAIKFSSPDATVEVSAGRKRDHSWLSIRDEGPGFSEKDKHQLFQKFRKLSARPTAGETSNGLGLAIVKTLVDRLKGTIELISNNGRGSEFIIRFPKKTRVSVRARKKTKNALYPKEYCAFFYELAPFPAALELRRVPATKKIIQYRPKYRQQYHNSDPYRFLFRIFIAAQHLDNNQDVDNEDQ